MNTLEVAVQMLAVVMAIVVLALAGIGLWEVRRRRRMWEDYERERGR